MSTEFTIDADWASQYIDGEFVPSESGETIDVEDPSTREQVTEVPAGVQGISWSPDGTRIAFTQS
ncbi:hypothetical protein, partial [Halolamina salina]